MHRVVHREVLIRRRGTVSVELRLEGVGTCPKPGCHLCVAHDKATGTRLHTLVLAFDWRELILRKRRAVAVSYHERFIFELKHLKRWLFQRMEWAAIVARKG